MNHLPYIHLGKLIQSIVAEMDGRSPGVAILLPHKQRMDVYAHLGREPDPKDLPWVVVYKTKTGAWQRKNLTEKQKEQFIS